MKTSSTTSIETINRRNKHALSGLDDSIVDPLYRSNRAARFGMSTSGIHEHQRNPSAVINSSCFIFVNTLEAIFHEQFLHPLRQEIWPKTADAISRNKFVSSKVHPDSRCCAKSTLFGSCSETEIA
ncbi:hypothetical protein OIU85_003893 [Salix viminalis]|uniref:Uncharacterized protein n=1 Tax=Salix viminalis TaxID=40686 RepID=A0A9Q0Q0K5_SALVM|nr:hypothetical protein OIU85_003893 [Salix viminalis]